MTPIVACRFQGRFGNQMFSYAYARAYAEKYGYEFQCDPWLGQKVFMLDDKPITATWLKERNENDIVEGEGNISILSYCQQQKCLIYTQRQVREWFKFQRWIQEELLKLTKMYPVVAHRRAGDYAGYNYPIVRLGSYLEKAVKLNCPSFAVLTEESPLNHPSFSGELSFLPDFYVMAHADILIRGNSTFSWWAATLNRHGRIYSPVVDGLEGGKEHDCQWADGNWPRFCSLPFVTDLHLQP